MATTGVNGENRDRRFELWLAGIAAVAVVGSGLIASGAAYVASKQQIDSQRSMVDLQAEQEQSTFLRDQRQEAYSKLLRDEQLHYQLVEEFHANMGIARDNPDTPIDKVYPDFEEDLEAINQGNAELSRDVSDIQVVGEDDVAFAAQQLQFAEAYLTGVAFYEAGIAPTVPDVPGVDKPTVQESLAEVDDKRAEYVLAVRASLEVDG